jgi:hypothetical protein
MGIHLPNCRTNSEGADLRKILFMAERPKLFQGETLIIATQHQKERAIAPVFEQTFGMNCATPSNFNTDEFGTFSGEKERIGTPLDAARQKCRAAFACTNGEYCVANEGSFGPHPSLFFIPADEEWMLFTNRSATLEIYVRLLSPKTNFAGESVESEVQLLDFAHRAGFPEHGLILKAGPQQTYPMWKGIINKNELIHNFRSLQKISSPVWVETDMRACFNPTRMLIIREAAEKLAEKIATPCPDCSAPGFGLNRVQPGLPCSLCGAPTKSPLYEIHLCQQCGELREFPFPHGKQYEDPTYCDFCNP